MSRAKEKYKCGKIKGKALRHFKVDPKGDWAGALRLEETGRGGTGTLLGQDKLGRDTIRQDKLGRGRDQNKLGGGGDGSKDTTAEFLGAMKDYRCI